MGFLSDFSDLTNSLGAFASSISHLVDVKQQVTAQRVGVELESEMNNIINRTFADISDPTKINQDNWRTAVSEYETVKNNILSKYSSYDVKTVAQDVANRYDQSFMNNFTARYYQAYRQNLVNDYFNILSAKASEASTEDGLHSFLNSAEDKKIRAIMSPEELQKSKEITYKTKGLFLLQSAANNGELTIDTINKISSGEYAIGDIFLKDDYERGVFTNEVLPMARKQQTESFKNTADGIVSAIKSGEIAGITGANALMDIMKRNKDNVLIDKNVYDEMRMKTDMVFVDNNVKQIVSDIYNEFATSRDAIVTDRVIESSLSKLNKLKDELAEGGYSKSLEYVESTIKYVQGLGSSAGGGSGNPYDRNYFLINTAKLMFMDNPTYSLASLYGMMNDENLPYDVRNKAVQTIVELRTSNNEKMNRPYNRILDFVFSSNDSNINRILSYSNSNKPEERQMWEIFNNEIDNYISRLLYNPENASKLTGKDGALLLSQITYDAKNAAKEFASSILNKRLRDNAANVSPEEITSVFNVLSSKEVGPNKVEPIDIQEIPVLQKAVTQLQGDAQQHGVGSWYIVNVSGVNKMVYIDSDKKAYEVSRGPDSVNNPFAFKPVDSSTLEVIKTEYKDVKSDATQLQAAVGSSVVQPSKQTTPQQKATQPQPQPKAVQSQPPKIESNIVFNNNSLNIGARVVDNNLNTKEEQTKKLKDNKNYNYKSVTYYPNKNSKTNSKNIIILYNKNNPDDYMILSESGPKYYDVTSEYVEKLGSDTIINLIGGIKQ